MLEWFKGRFSRGGREWMVHGQWSPHSSSDKLERPCYPKRKTLLKKSEFYDWRELIKFVYVMAVIISYAA